MRGHIAFLSLLTPAVVLAQSAGSTTNNLIPTGISQSCSTFLNSFNSDPSMKTCTSSLIATTSAYAPGSNTASSSSTSQIQSALNSLCSASTSNSCPESSVREWLTQFYQSCSAELTSSPVDQVRTLYDVMYTLWPLMTALCSKDDNGSYCATKIPSASGLQNAISTTGGSSSSLTDIMNSLAQNTPTVSRRADTTALMPNTSTFQSTNLPFLFLQPASGNQAALQSSDQCTTCTRKIMAAYINFESDTPYGPGLGSSILLAKQQALYQAITTTCGQTFMSGVVQAAGGLSGGSLPSAATPNVVSATQGLVTVWMGLLAGAVSLVF